VTRDLPGLTRTNIIRTRYRGDTAKEKAYFDTYKMALDPADVARCVSFALSQPRSVQIATAGRAAAQPLVGCEQRIASHHLPDRTRSALQRATRKESTAAARRNRCRPAAAPRGSHPASGRSAAHPSRASSARAGGSGR
jgi:hypothetical protein